MASKTADFFENGSVNQFEFVLSKYQEALQVKADSKNSKTDTLIKLDNWFQNELPKKIKSRGKEAHLTHDELVQTIKWKLARGKFRPRLKDLIQMNTPRVVIQETKKSFRNLFKRNDLEASIHALCNLKGVGPAMASAVLAAAAPETAPFMADECLLSMPDIEGIDYTMKEYMKYVEKTRACVERLNSSLPDTESSWTPHKVELAIWTHYVAYDLKPELLFDMPSRHIPGPDGDTGTSIHAASSEGVNGEASNGAETTLEGVTTNGVNGTETPLSESTDSESTNDSVTPQQKEQPTACSQNDKPPLEKAVLSPEPSEPLASSKRTAPADDVQDDYEVKRMREDSSAEASSSSSGMVGLTAPPVIHAGGD
jgi:hypothetical protein